MDYQKVISQIKSLNPNTPIDLRGFNIFDSLKIVTTASVQHFALCNAKHLCFLVSSDEAKNIILQSSLQNVKVETSFDKELQSLAV